MNQLPNSFYVVLAFIAIAIILIVFFLSRQALFLLHKQRGKEALRRKDYQRAIKSLGRAERLWGLNVTKQTIPSYQRDLINLDEILDGLKFAAQAQGINLAVDEYRASAKAVLAELQGNERGENTLRRESYVTAFTLMKNAQILLRNQLREYLKVAHKCA